MASFDVRTLAELTSLADRQEVDLTVNLVGLHCLRDIPTARKYLDEVLVQGRRWICPNLSKLNCLFGIVVELTRVEADLWPRVCQDDTEALLLLDNATHTIIRRTGNSDITRRLANSIGRFARQTEQILKEVEAHREGVVKDAIRRRLAGIGPAVTALLDGVPVTFMDPPVGSRQAAAALRNQEAAAASITIQSDGAEAAAAGTSAQVEAADSSSVMH